MRHLIDSLDLSVAETQEILDLADRIAGDPAAYAHCADGKILATLFYEPSTRTRLSFETANVRKRATDFPHRRTSTSSELLLP